MKTHLNIDSILNESIPSSKIDPATIKTINGESLLGDGDLEINVEQAFVKSTGSNSAVLDNSFNSEASGKNSIAGGVKAIASGNYSVALGRYTEARGRGSIALGGLTKGFTFTGNAGVTTYITDITEDYSEIVLVGLKCFPTTESNDSEFWTITKVELLDGKYQVTLDKTIDSTNTVNKKLYVLFNVASGTSSISLGGLSSGAASFCGGQFNRVDGKAAIALGDFNRSYENYCFTAGYNNIAGNTNTAEDNNSCVAMGHSNKAVGKQAVAIGYGNQSLNNLAISMGTENVVSSRTSVAIGGNNTVENEASAAIGAWNTVKANHSVAMGGGNTVNGSFCDIALGYYNTINNDSSVALGYECTTNNDGEIALGIRNNSHRTAGVDEACTLLSVGNNTSSNAFEIMHNGDIWLGEYEKGIKLYDGPANKLLIDNGIKIVNSVDELDPDALQGSLASVAVNTIVEVNFSELYQPTPDEFKITETGAVVDTTNLSGVNSISINSSYDTTTEIPNFMIYLFSKDVDMQGGVGQMVGLAAGVAVTMNVATQEQQVLELFTPNEDGTITANEENLVTINNLLSSTEFVYGGVRDEGNGEFLYHHPCIDVFYKATNSIQKTELYIKEVNGWKELKTGGSIETVDNLEDTSTDKALSANMGRVLNERISAVASGSVTSVAGTLNIKDLNAVKAAQELLSNNQQVTYIITDSNGNYPSPNNSTVYIDTEDHILDILYRGNGDALKWLLKNKQAYYNYSGSWYSQTISEDLVKLPSLHLRTAQVGDLITLIRQDIPAEEFYSNFVDYNNINLNLGTTEKLAFDAYLTFAGVKGALESISDGEAIRRLVEGGYIYSSEGDPNNGYTPNKLVSDEGLVTLYTAQITPNTQHLYNGEFWTGNMTGAGIYSYINNPDPAIPDREEGEVYTGYVSPDGTQTLVSMKNPFKAYKKVNNAWEKLETDTNYKTRYGWGTSLDSMLKTGVCAYTPAIVADIDANWTIFVTCSSDGDPTYYHLMQTAICRNDDKLGRIFQRMGWYKGNGEDLHFTDWKEVGGGSGNGEGTGTYLEINHGTSDTTFTLTPNTFHVWGEVPSLYISFAPEIAGIANEYVFQFSSGSTPTVLTIDGNVKWADIPNMSANKTYQISILKGLASIMEFS